MTHFQTVNDILIWDRIRIWTNQIQNMLVTAFNRQKETNVPIRAFATQTLYIAPYFSIQKNQKMITGIS